jgi:hypothetical protein
MHELDLRAGEPHTVVGQEVLVSPDCTDEVLDVLHTETSTSQRATIRLGHQGKVLQEVILEPPVDLSFALAVLTRSGPRRTS